MLARAASAPPRLSGHIPVALGRFGSAGPVPAIEDVAVETPVALLYNGISHVVMMATPGDLEDFAVGFSVAEGVVARIGEIAAIAVSAAVAPSGTAGDPGIVAGYRVDVTIPEERAAAVRMRQRNLSGRTGCGVCGVAEIDQVLRPLPSMPAGRTIAPAAINRAMRELPQRQQLNGLTGAVHAAGFADREGRLVTVREDVGRHNALDKLIGGTLREGYLPADGFVVVTSRCSMEMVQKTALFGAPLIAAVSAPTSLAISLADGSGVALVAFARGAGFNVYSHPERIASP